MPGVPGMPGMPQALREDLRTGVPLACDEEIWKWVSGRYLLDIC